MLVLRRYFSMMYTALRTGVRRLNHIVRSGPTTRALRMFTRKLRFECLELRRMLAAVLLWNPGNDPDPEWTSNTTAHTAKDWEPVINGVPTGANVDWTNGSVAAFLAAGTSASSPAVVSISSTATDLVFASTIDFLSTNLSGVRRPATTLSKRPTRTRAPATTN